MKEQTISIKRTFSVFNPNCPQVIIVFDNDEAWSLAQVNVDTSCSWNAMLVEINDKNEIVKHHEKVMVGDDDFFNLDDLTTQVWKKVNNISDEEFEAWLDAVVSDKEKLKENIS